jgi:hypothetical protein
VSGLVEVVRHLDRDCATGRTGGEEPDEHGQVIRHPLEDGIAEDHVKRGRGREVVDVGDDEVGRGQPLARRGDHFRR